MILRSKKVMIPFNLFDAKNYKKQKFSFLNLPFTDNLFFRTESIFKTKFMNPHTKKMATWCCGVVRDGFDLRMYHLFEERKGGGHTEMV